MNQATFRRYGILAQVSLVFIFFMVNFLEFLPDSTLVESIVYALNYTVMAVVVVYLHYFYLFPLYFKGHRWKYFAAVVLLMTLSICFSYLIEIMLPFDDFSDYGASDLFMSLVYDYLLLTMIVAYSSLYYFVEEWFKNIKTEAQLRTEKLHAELNFLKSQINPHFLFNTLNNIYSYAQTNNQKTAPMLERLSSILRFMVYDCGEDRVELSKEIEAIESLLEIHKMKNSAQLNIEFSVLGIKGFHLIAPLILVNFVENACKHSDVINNKDGFIRIQISVDDSNFCCLELSNTFKEKVVVENRFKGFGLINVKKRLKLQYGENFTFNEEKSKWSLPVKIRNSTRKKKVNYEI